MTADTRLTALIDAARLVLGDHSCARCDLPTAQLLEHPEYHPECLLRRALEAYRADR